jgi:hypothetical protein
MTWFFPFFMGISPAAAAGGVQAGNGLGEGTGVVKLTYVTGIVAIS